MTKSKLFRTLVVVGFVAVWHAWRQARRPRRHLRLLVGFTFGNIIGDAAGYVGGFFTDIGQRVKDFVVQAIDVAGGLLQSGIDYVLAVGHAAALWASSVYDLARQFATDLYNGAVAIAQTLANQVIDFVWTQVGALVGLIRALVDGVTGIAVGLYNAAVAVASAALGAAFDLLVGAVNNVIALASTLYQAALAFTRAAVDAAFSLLSAAIETATGLALSAVNRVLGIMGDITGFILPIIRQIVDPIFGAFENLVLGVIDKVTSPIMSRLHDVERWLYDRVGNLISVVESCIDFLIWLGQHSWADVVAFSEWFVNYSPADLLDDMARIVDQHYDEFEQAQRQHLKVP